MSALSSTAVLPLVATPSIAAQEVAAVPEAERSPHPDWKLVFLGQRLSDAVQQMNACYERSDHLRDCNEYKVAEAVLLYRPGSEVDRALARALRWTPAAQSRDCPDCLRFCPRDAERLEALLPSLRGAQNRRALELIASEQTIRRLDTTLGIVEADKAAQDAYEAAARIVDEIEGSAARSLEGLKVKVEAIRFCRTGDLADEDCGGTDMRLAQSILLDLSAL